MKNYLSSILFLMLCIAVSGCSEDFSESSNYLLSLSPRYLNVSPEDIIFEAYNSSPQTIGIQSIQTPWSVENSVSWIHVTPNSGDSDNAYLTVSVDDNPNVNAERKGIFYIKADIDGKDYKRAVSVTQTVANPTLSLSETNFNLSGESQTVTVKVNANCSWSVQSEDESWCTVSSDGYTITINVKSNETNESRSCRIQINYGNQKVEYISLYQQVIDLSPANAQAVDLGLPSGLKWANMNIGATQVSDYGNYYAWGETEPQSSDRYDLDSYKWCKDSYNTMTKYCVSSSYGTVDGKKVLDPEDDAAHVNWGGDWRMPTHAEQEELVNNTTSTWTSNYNGTGVAGRIVTGPNGNSIFLPAAGARSSSSFGFVGSYGGYWSSSLVESNGNSAYALNFLSSSVGMPIGSDSDSRYYGQSVRAVCR